MESRYGAFQSGMVAPSGIQTYQFTPNSVLQPYMHDPRNGNSAADASRQTPYGQLPSMNGMAPSTYAVKNPNFGTKLNI